MPESKGGAGRDGGGPQPSPCGGPSSAAGRPLRFVAATCVPQHICAQARTDTRPRLPCPPPRSCILSFGCAAAPQAPLLTSFLSLTLAFTMRPHAAPCAGPPSDADAWRQLVLRLAARLPPADIIQLPAGGYLVVRRRSSQGSTRDGSSHASTQLAAGQLRRAASSPLTGRPAGPGRSPLAGWSADQEQRYQRQLAALRRSVGGPTPGRCAPAGGAAPALPARASRPVPVPRRKAGQEAQPGAAAAASLLEGSLEPGE